VLTDPAEAQPRVGSAAIAITTGTPSSARRSAWRSASATCGCSGDTAIDSGTLTYFEMRDGNATTSPGRYSLTYQKRGGKWLIVDHHTSAAR